MTAWLENHGEAQTTPILLAAMQGLKKEGFKEFASTGYCFGGNVSRILPDARIDQHYRLVLNSTLSN
jgi:hypothetical protein